MSTVQLPPASAPTPWGQHLPRLTSAQFSRLSLLIHEQCGIRITETKRSMLEGRLQKRLRALGLGSFGDYCSLLSGDGLREELVPLIDSVTTNKTDFFRESAHFDFLRSRILQQPSQRSPLRAWSAGCSTGEEPYTLAMVLAEAAGVSPGFAFDILATDVSTRVLEQAVRGVYREERLQPVPTHLQRKYFLRSRDRSAGTVRVAPELRAKVRFRRLNFMERDYGIAESLDLIFCRNVIIYFDRSTQQRLLERLCGHLAPGGHLFMGHSETLNGMGLPLVQVAPSAYRRL